MDDTLAPGCKRVKLRIDCHDLRQRNCFIHTTCCNDGCNNPNIIGKRDDILPRSLPGFLPIPGSAPHAHAPKLSGPKGLVQRNDETLAPGCKRVKLRIDCHDLRQRNCFIHTTCCNDGCNNPNIIPRDALPQPIPEPKKPKHKEPDRYPACGAPICKLRRALSSLFSKRDALPKPVPQPQEDYPSCGAPTCKLRRALANIKRKRNAEKSASEWALPASIHGGDTYPHCGAPICTIRRSLNSLLGERDASPDDHFPITIQPHPDQPPAPKDDKPAPPKKADPLKPAPAEDDQPAVCGFLCKLRRSSNLKKRNPSPGDHFPITIQPRPDQPPAPKPAPAPPKNADPPKPAEDDQPATC
ncbi:MAG: hypothetical protein Q9218_007939, partial [Villophora microphyllina]